MRGAPGRPRRRDGGGSSRRATQAVLALARRDLRLVTRSSAVVVPIVVVPLVLLVGIPLVFGALAPLGGRSAGLTANLGNLLARMPPHLLGRFEGLPPTAQALSWLLVYLMAPMLLILPLMVASVIAADSFAGEKERKTLEALLYTPTSDLELVVAKLLVSLVPAVAVSWGGLLAYSAVADAVMWPYLHRLVLPDPLWLVLGLWVTPGVAGLGLAVTVLVSARVKSFQEAYQLGGVVVLPVVALVAGQAAGVVYLSSVAALVAGALLLLLDVALVAWGLRGFSRDRLASQA